MQDLFENDPIDYALTLVENHGLSYGDLILCALKYMSDESVKKMLDANELSPRFIFANEGADHA